MKQTNNRKSRLSGVRRAGFILSWFCMWMAVPVSLRAATDSLSVFDQIIENIVQQELENVNIASENDRTRSYLQSLSANGAFPDIDYTSTAQTNWAPVTHLDRMKSMVLSYMTPGSSYEGNDTLHAAIVDMLEYWYQANPTSTNWYMWEIAWPQRMGLNLSLLRAGREPVPADLESRILNRMKSISKGPNQSGSQGTGANKMDIALQWIYRTCLQADKEQLDFAVSQFYYPLTFNTGEGLQSDYSYLQHGPQLYIGGYGQSVLTATFKVAFYLLNTEYAEGESMQYISGFIRQAYLPAVRGQYMLYNSIGRGFARKNGLSRSGFSASLEKMIRLDPTYTNTYRYGIERLTGREAASCGLRPYHRHFWRGDYTLHQRPAYTVDVRMASTRTYRCENGNGENLRGYFITEGGTSIARRGDEYLDIFPVWDWSRIPGTTTPVLASVPVPAAWGQAGQSTFAGGVSDGIYGVTAYRMVDNSNGINTSGKKSWFFFDKEVICMGTDIRSTNANAINTTVNQTLLNGAVEVRTADAAESSVQEKGLQEYADLRWVVHDSVAYYFPEGGNVTVRNDVQTGTWNHISSNSGDATVQEKDVFKVWFNHGVRPQGAQYVYYMVPGVGTADEAVATLDEVQLKNNDTVQAVYNHSLHMLGVVFHEKGTVRIGDMEVSTSAPCVALFTQTDSTEVRAYVADPSCQLDSLTVYAKFPRLAYKALGCRLDRSAHYAGTTHSYSINADTPDSVYVAVQQVKLDEHACELGYEMPYARLTAQVEPADASRPELTWQSSDESVVWVDALGRLCARGAGQATVRAIASDGPGDSCVVTVVDALCALEPTADAYVYDGATTTNYGQATAVVVRTDGAGYNRQGYFKFPIALPDSVSADNLKAKLMLYVTSGAENVAEATWRAYRVVSTLWNEVSITWSNKPRAVTGSLLDDFRCFIPSSAFSLDNYASFDLSSLVPALYRNGQQAFSLLIDQDVRATGGKGTSSFASREHESAIMHPRVFYSWEPTPMGMADIKKDKTAIIVEDDYLIISAVEHGVANVYTLQGNLVRQAALSPREEARIVIGQLPPGIYIVNVGHASYRFVK